MVSKALTWSAVIGAASLWAAGLASSTTSNQVFYLSLRPPECLIAKTIQGTKKVPVVPCSNAAHNLEVYAVEHGGWGHNNPPADAYALVRAVCLSAYQRLTGHPLARTAGWQGYWPDPGAETTRYGDRVVCNFRTWPALRPLGSGRHVR
jgi:hypothetical protein